MASGEQMNPVPGLDPVEAFQSLGSGAVAHDLYERIVLLGEKVLRTQRSGTVTLKLKVDPVKGSDCAFIVTEEFAVKEPKEDPHGAIFMTVGDGRLHQSDPRQTRFEATRTAEGAPLELRVVDQAAPHVREAGGS